MLTEHVCGTCHDYRRTTTRTGVLCETCGTLMNVYGPTDDQHPELTLARHKSKRRLANPAQLAPVVPTGRELTIDEAHALTGIPKRTLRDKCASGAIPAEKRPDVWNLRPRWRIPEGVLPFLAANLD